MASAEDRPARKQVATKPGPQKAPTGHAAGGGGDFNIWYGKKIGRQEKEALQATTRMVPSRDTGRTQASRGDRFCVYFAQGRCKEGPRCLFQHRIPTADDDKMLSNEVDLFGRERHGSDRDDMGGIGSFSRENTTLYVGKVPAGGAGRDVKREVREQFEVFGSLEAVRFPKDKECAFVKYRFRGNAELAREAMMGQSLAKGDLPLNIKWATEDPNPGAQKRERERTERRVRGALQEQGVCLKQTSYAYPSHYQVPDDAQPPPAKRPHAHGAPPPRPLGGAVDAYPDTDAQYGSGALGGEGRHRAPPGAGGQWVAFYTPEGYPYWHNTRTQETTWECPAGMPPLAAPQPPAPGQPLDRDPAGHLLET